jgi:hypothetical protein
VTCPFCGHDNPEGARFCPPNVPRPERGQGQTRRSSLRARRRSTGARKAVQGRVSDTISRIRKEHPQDCSNLTCTHGDINAIIAGWRSSS